MTQSTTTQYPIERYRVYFFTRAEREPARILLYGPGGLVRGIVRFRPEGAELPEPVVRRRTLEDGEAYDELTMYYPVSQLTPLVDLLRYEDPITLFFEPENGKGGIATGVEPVGEAE